MHRPRNTLTVAEGRENARCSTRLHRTHPYRLRTVGRGGRPSSAQPSGRDRPWNLLRLRFRSWTRKREALKPCSDIARRAVARLPSGAFAHHTMWRAGTVRVPAASFDCALNPGTTPHTISAAVAPKSPIFPASLGPTFNASLFTKRRTHCHHSTSSSA